MKINPDINWEQRRFEIAKEIYPIFIEAAMSDNDNFFVSWMKNKKKDITKEPALFAVKFAETLTYMLMAQNDIDNETQE